MSPHTKLIWKQLYMMYVLLEIQSDSKLFKYRIFYFVLEIL